ncbi:MAG: phosphate acyltransferase PlsX [Acidimicrobiales bacterium]
MSEPARLPVAVDAMGGDKAPEAIVEGARRAAKAGLEVLLVGPEEIVEPSGLPAIVASEQIGMGEDPASAVRQKKDSSLVRAAEAVRDGRACAMVSAGNTGAAMASALLRLGRARGVARPAIATPIPVPGSTPTVLLDAGANSDCQPAWLVQFAQLGAVFASQRFGIERPRVGLLSIGEEASKGNALVKEAHRLLSSLAGQPAPPGPAGPFDFIGNVEGRDLPTRAVDVAVCDGFTGNVVLKALEGGVKMMVEQVMGAMTSTAEAREAAKVLLPQLAPLVEELDPESYGGAMLLGVAGVCVISHGSSSAKAIYNAVAMAHGMAAGGLLEALERAVEPTPGPHGPETKGERA